MAPGPGGGLPSIAAMPTHPATNTDVLVLQHTLEDGPGYLGQWLDAHGHTWQVRCTEAGEAYPASVDGFRALAVLGGEWSANDDRPSLRQAEALIRQADARGIPVIGHCLGGQLMARAFGGRVERLPMPEVGWLPVRREPGADAALLALVASLGLAQLAHETTPSPAQLCFSAVLLYAAARLVSPNARWLSLSVAVWWLGMLGLSWSGAPAASPPRRIRTR